MTRALLAVDYGLKTYGDLFTPATSRTDDPLRPGAGSARARRATPRRPASPTTRRPLRMAAPVRRPIRGIGVYLAFALSRSVDRGSTICSWDNSPKMRRCETRSAAGDTMVVGLR